MSRLGHSSHDFVRGNDENGKLSLYTNSHNIFINLLNELDPFVYFYPVYTLITQATMRNMEMTFGDFLVSV